MFVEDKTSGETPSFEGFYKFCKSRDPNEKYKWRDADKCACAQYLKSINQFTNNWVHSVDIMRALNSIAGGRRGQIEFEADGNHWPKEYKESDWTFGKCAERLEKIKG